MAVHSKDEALMCKVFPSSLGPVAMRWFDSLRADSIGFFKELTRAFGSRFVTCNRVPWPLGSLLSLSMGDSEDILGQILGDVQRNIRHFDDVAISTFKIGLPVEHGLRKSLTGKLVTSVCQLMD